MFKLSFYNIIIPNLSDENFKCIYNSKSGSIIKLEQLVYNDLMASNFDSSSLKKFINELFKQGIIIDENKDEIQEILFNMKTKQYEKSGVLSLVIAPTLQCNYRCVYCFENNHSNFRLMDEKEINRIVEFIKKYLNEYPNTHKLRIQWFGGEPLLAFHNIIKPLSDLMIKLANERNIEYVGGIVTNGYLLNKNTIISLVEECKIEEFQITFDGQEDNYNRMKCPPINAYEITKNNIFMLSEYKSNTHAPITVNIRINVDNTNADDARLFVQEIQRDERYKNNFKFYLGRIRGTDNSINISDFEIYEKEFNDILNRPFYFTNPKKIWCNQYTYNSFCIGPSGELYKCEHDFGCQERVIGDLETGLYFNDYLFKFMNQSISDSCKECKIFPICLGGCPNQKFYSKQNHSCEFTLDYVIRCVEEYVAIKDKNKQ